MTAAGVVINWFFGEIEFAFRTVRSFITGRGAPTLPLDDGDLLAQAEEQREVWEAPLSATFTDEPEISAMGVADESTSEPLPRLVDSPVGGGVDASSAPPTGPSPIETVRTTESSDAVSAVSVEDPPAGDYPSPVGADSGGGLIREAAEKLRWYVGEYETSLTAQINARAFVKKLEALAASLDVYKPRDFPCVVDGCPETLRDVDDLNMHSYWMHMEDDPSKVSDDPHIAFKRYPGADSAGDFMWHHVIVTSGVKRGTR